MIEIKNQAMQDTLVVIAESSTKKGVVPTSKSTKKTVCMRLYETLKNNPYTYNQYELFKEVHFNQRKRFDLKIETYQIQRSELCSLYGWGIHGNSEGKLALVACESPLYIELLNDISIKKKNSYKKQIPNN